MEGKAGGNNHMEHFSRNINLFRDKTIEILVYLLFRVTRALVVTLQKFTWAVLGVERIRRDAARGLQFKQSAHVQEIFWKRQFLDYEVADPSHFITTHKGFRPPSCVFKPNVSLYCMTTKEAVFIECLEAENLYKSRHSHYMYQNQYEHAVRLIHMPLASFHKMASDVGDPRVPVTWMACTPRGGATLLSEMMYRIPGMMSLCEPDAITTLGLLYKKKLLQPSEYKALLSSCVRLLCKPDDRYSAVFLKARPSTTALLEDIVQLFPRFRYLFMYRNSMKSLMSNLGQWQMEPAPKTARMVMDSGLSSMLPLLRTVLYNNLVLLNEKKTSIVPKKLNTVGILTCAWAASVAQVQELRYRGYMIGSILYEDFMINPRRSLAELLAMLDVRREALGPAAEALKADVNRGLHHDAGLDARRALTPGDRMEADNVLKAYGLAKLGERMEVSGLLKLE